MELALPGLFYDSWTVGGAGLVGGEKGNLSLFLPFCFKETTQGPTVSGSQLPFPQKVGFLLDHLQK